MSAADTRIVIKILEEYHADGISVLRLEDTSIPGCCEFWRVDRHHERVKFFIIVLNTSDLRQDLALQRLSLSHFATARGGRAADTLQAQLEHQASVLATHYFLSGWDKDVHGVDAKGRGYHSHRVYGLRLHAVDLQGTAGIFSGDRYAKRFSRKIVQQLASNEFREFHRHNTWSAAVRSIDWLQWLDGLSKQHIDPYHILQPRRGGDGQPNPRR